MIAVIVFLGLCASAMVALAFGALMRRGSGPRRAREEQGFDDRP